MIKIDVQNVRGRCCSRCGINLAGEGIVFETELPDGKAWRYEHIGVCPEQFEEIVMVKIRVKLSDAPEFEATVLRDNGDSLYVEEADGFRTVIRPWQVVSANDLSRFATAISAGTER